MVGWGGELTNAFAFVWTSDGGVRDLNTLTDSSGDSWNLRAAYDINNKGQIVGYGEANGVSHAFLLTPVPEPAFAALSGATMALATTAGRNRRRARGTLAEH